LRGSSCMRRSARCSSFRSGAGTPLRYDANAKVPARFSIHLSLRAQAKQSRARRRLWIASSPSLLAMTAQP
jgi:hypothetical protein